MRAVGIDLSAEQLGKARERWPGVAGLELHRADALTHLEHFAHPEHGPDEDPAAVKRWDFEPDAWALMLTEHGYVDVSASVVAPPPGNRRAGTLFVRGVNGGR
ncbi:hypothetical protein [Streptomyces marincola]|uniref:hypothetical protein n=1 Tax=Streptomyces marincola TaxID=2878388 RepID=UPI00210035EC|nr:hypothetical protein [Streptomyces marincola]